VCSSVRLFVTFLPRDAMLARCMLSSCVRLSVCLSGIHRSTVAAIVSKRLDKSSWVFLALMLPSTCPTLCRAHKEIWESPKIRALSSGTNSGLRKFHHLRQVDRVVNKTHRRQQSSLLTTSIRQSTSSGYLLQVIIVSFAQ